MARDAFYNKFDSTGNLNETLLSEVEEFARGLELIEISDYFGFELVEVGEGEYTSDVLGKAEIKWLVKSFKRGRANAMKVAVDKLFSSMGDRNGQNASLPYLRRFAKEWPGDDQVKEGDLLVFRAKV